MTAPTQLSDEDAKKDYLALCLKMTHAQLYAELMRVHKEATLLIQQAVEQNNREWIGLTDDELKALCDEWQIIYGGYVKPFAETIEAKLKDRNHGNNT